MNLLRYVFILGNPLGTLIFVQKMAENTFFVFDTYFNDIIDLDYLMSLDKLKKRLEKTGYLEELIKKFFLNNNHRLTFQLVPDVMLDQKKEKKQEVLLSEKLNSLTKNAKKKIGELTAELEKRQNLSIQHLFC